VCARSGFTPPLLSLAPVLPSPCAQTAVMSLSLKSLFYCHASTQAVVINNGTQCPCSSSLLINTVATQTRTLEMAKHGVVSVLSIGISAGQNYQYWSTIWYQSQPSLCHYQVMLLGDRGTSVNSPNGCFTTVCRPRFELTTNESPLTSVVP